MIGGSECNLMIGGSECNIMIGCSKCNIMIGCSKRNIMIVLFPATRVWVVPGQGDNQAYVLELPMNKIHV